MASKLKFLTRATGTASAGQDESKPAPVEAPATSAAPSETPAKKSVFNFGKRPASAGVAGTNPPVESQPAATAVTVHETVAEAEVPTDGPAGFQHILDSLDALCRDAAGITPLVHDSVKQHVRKVMEELRVNPEMRGLIIDRDVHNIMMFVQASTRRADVKFVEQATRKEKKSNKKIQASIFDDALAALLPAGPAASLDSLGSLNTDDIETKNR